MADVHPIQAKKVHLFSRGRWRRRWSRGFWFLGGRASVASLAGEREHLIVRGLTLLTVTPTVGASVGPAWFCRWMRQRQKGRRQRRETQMDKVEKTASDTDNNVDTGR